MYRIIDYLMKRTRITFILLIIITAGLIICAVRRPGTGTDKRRVIMQLMMTGLQAEHFQSVPPADSMSVRVFKLYLQRLDYFKQYFTQEDIAKFRQYETQIDGEIQNGSFEFFDFVNGVFAQRVAYDTQNTKQILSQPFDFSTNEDFQPDPEKSAFAKDDKELAERRRKMLKLQTLYKLNDMMSVQEKAQETKDTSVKIKSFSQLEKDARAAVLKSNSNIFQGIAETTENDKLSAYFDCIANACDPHTEYFAPIEREDFDVKMSGQLEGIGATLRDKNGNITIESVVPGSPAWKSGEIKEGDVIMKVAQDTGEPVDIEGMRLDKAVHLIRGKKGTRVKLTIRKVNHTVKVITLVRDIIQIKETYAHDAIIQQGKNIGYIHLPEFYTRFGENTYRTCSEDVKKEILELDKQNVQGIIMDLRENGGGSLQDVVKMVGLFINAGPVVQIKGHANQVQVLTANDTAAIYKGPLIVLVNGYSASASEIFAAAIQDYKRGVIMGSPTYGKGTVQQIFDLDDYVSPSFKSLKPLGSVKITISKFYRINGGTTQRDGVTPDIQLPDSYSALYVKEKNSDYPMPWDKIKPATYTIWNNPPDYDKLRSSANKDVAHDSAFILISEEAQNNKKLRDHGEVSLNLEQFRKQQKEQTEENKKFGAITKVIGDMKIIPTTGEDQKMQADTNEMASEKKWMKQLTKDPELYEATRVIDYMR